MGGGSVVQGPSVAMLPECCQRFRACLPPSVVGVPRFCWGQQLILKHMSTTTGHILVAGHGVQDDVGY